MVVDGGMFWLGKLIPTGMPAYYRGTGPDSLNNVMLTGINIPIRIGNATVMPGDLVFGDSEGLYFIPPSQVEAILDSADTIHIHDEWTRKKFAEWGLANIHEEEWPFGKGWALQRFSANMVEPQVQPLIGYPHSWTPSTPGAVTAEESKGPVMETLWQTSIKIILSEESAARDGRSNRRPARRKP